MSLRESAGFIPCSEARVRGSIRVMIQLTDATHRRAAQPRRGLKARERLKAPTKSLDPDHLLRRTNVQSVTWSRQRHAEAPPQQGPSLPF